MKKDKFYNPDLGTFKMNFGFAMPMRYINKKVKSIAKRKMPEASNKKK
tara:strand:- start:473 stop:616 length:144 start_codon:yes stop_codon:yes gene_type:complete